MSVGPSVPAGLCFDADSSGLIRPIFDRQREFWCTGLASNVLKFEYIKILFFFSQAAKKRKV